MDKQFLQQLRDLPIEEVASRLGLDVSRHKALCPFHDDHHASLSFHQGRNTYRCFVCDAHGGTIDLAMAILHYDFRQACTWLSNNSIEPIQPIQTHQTHSTHSTHQTHQTHSTHSAHSPQKPFQASRYERFFQHPHLSPEARQFLFGERRLHPRVISWCRLSSWRDRHGTPWLQIPYYSTEGSLVGLQYRNLTPGAEPRFRFPQGSECGVYNLPVLKRLRPGEELWIAEGASDCWALLSAGHKAIAIPSATLLKSKDVETLEALSLKLETPFHMAPDRDEPGERLFLQLQRLLPNLTHHHLPPNCKDYSQYYLKVKNENKNENFFQPQP